MKMTSLDAAKIKGWNLSLTQLQNYLAQEAKTTEQLRAKLDQATLELTKATETFGKVGKIIMPTFDFEQANKENIINAIVSLRAQNLSLQAKINQIKAQTAELKAQTEKKQKESGGSAHEKYKRVMEGLTTAAADIRETWDSDDVLVIDDYVLENGVSYDEAREAIERERATVDFSQPLSEDE